MVLDIVIMQTNVRILVTAFEPFGGSDTNISQRVLDAIQADVAVKQLNPVSKYLLVSQVWMRAKL